MNVDAQKDKTAPVRVNAALLSLTTIISQSAQLLAPLVNQTAQRAQNKPHPIIVLVDEKATWPIANKCAAERRARSRV